MPDTEHYHHFEHTHTDEPPSGTQGRRVTIRCTTCDTQIVQITKRTDAEIQDELNQSNNAGIEAEASAHDHPAR